MLFGTFEHNLDDKLRVTIPSKLRNKLGEMVYVSRSIDGECLEIRTPEAFKDWSENLGQENALLSSTRALKRTIFSNTDEVSIDNSGRIKLPANLIEEVGIKKTVQIAGAGDCIEVWDKEKFASYSDSIKKELVNVADKMGGAK